MNPEEEEIEETDDDDVIVVDLSKEEEPEKPEKPPKPAKAEKAAGADYEELLEKARETAREEVEKRVAKEPERRIEGNQRFSEEDLTKAEDELDEKLEAGEVGIKEARRMQRIIDAHRSRNREEESETRRSIETRMGTAEQIVSTWAKENAPVFLDETSKESKEAEKFLLETLGAQKSGDYYVLSKKVGRIAAGILSQANAKGKENEPARKKELASKQPARTGPPQKGKLAEVTRSERDILAAVGLRKERADLYQKFKKGLSGKRVVEVDN